MNDMGELKEPPMDLEPPAAPSAETPQAEPPQATPEAPKKPGFLMTAEEKLNEKRGLAPDAPASTAADGATPTENAGEAAQAESTTPEKSPYGQITELSKDPNFTYKDGVYGQLMMMVTYNVIKDADRTAQIAGMTLDELKKTPEFSMMNVRHEADEQQRPDLMGAEFVNSMFPRIEELKEQFKGMSAKAALDEFQEIERKKLMAEYIEEGMKKEKLSPDAEVPQEVRERITREAEERATLDARSRREKFFAAAGMMMGEYVSSSIQESDFGTFLDNFFSQAQARGNSFSRYKENFADKGKQGERIGAGTVLEHFRSSEDNLIKTLNIFYDDMARDKDHFSGIEKPGVLKEAYEIGNMSKKDLQVVLQHVAKLLREGDAKADKKFFFAFEKATLLTMNKTPENALIDERIIDNMIKIGDDTRSAEFDDFAKGFTKFAA